MATWISGQDSWDRLCQQLRGVPRLALDTEFVRRRTYHPVPALVQLATDDDVWLLDPLGVADYGALARLLADERTLKIAHSVGEDLEVFRLLCGAVPRPLFDTQVAAGFAGCDFGMGLARLVQELLGQTMDKAQTLSDWLRRPLSAAQMEYASADVRHLLPLQSALHRRLAANDNLGPAMQDCAEIADAPPPDAMQRCLRIKGMAALDERGWQALCALAQWREERAAQRDKPRSWILKDADMLRICRRMPRSAAELPDALRRRAPAIIKAMARPVAAPPRPAPAPPAELRALQQLAARIAEQRQIAPGQLARRADLQALAAGAADCILHRGWRAELVGAPLGRALAAMRRGDYTMTP